MVARGHRQGNSLVEVAQAIESESPDLSLDLDADRVNVVVPPDRV